ncbi:MAG: hypothetical protein ACP5HM_12820 [Anaerolineae bacterium]
MKKHKPWDRQEAQRRRLRYWLLLYLYIFLYLALYLALPTSQAALWFGYLLPLLTMFVATVTTGQACQAAGWNPRGLWFWLFLGAGLWLSAEIAWWIQDVLLAAAPDLSVADLLWIAGYGVIVAAILSHQRALPADGASRWGRRILVGAALASLGVFLALLWPAFYEGKLRGGLTTVVTASYPALDIFLAGGGVVMFFVSRRGNIWYSSWLFVGGAFLLWAFSDVWYWILIYIGGYGNNVRSMISVDIPDTLGNLFLSFAAWEWLSGSSTPVDEPGDSYMEVHDE